MLSEPLLETLNEQVKHEFDSAYLYLSMSLWFNQANLPGMASWMRSQYAEEIEHGMKFISFIEDRAGKVALGAIDRPESEFGSPPEAFRAALEHEKFITGKINDLYTLAEAESDYAAQSFLDWFVTEQVEEEKTAAGIVARLELAGDDRAALLLMDRELGEREK